MASSSIDFTTVINNLNNSSRRLNNQCKILCNSTAIKMQDFAQTNAPWTDRTVTARPKLKAISQDDGNGAFTMSVFQQVDYGIYLELCNNENYAILKKSRDAIVPEFLDAVKRIQL